MFSQINSTVHGIPEETSPTVEVERMHTAPSESEEKQTSGMVFFFSF